MYAGSTEWQLLQASALRPDAGLAVSNNDNPAYVMVLIMAAAEANWDPVEGADSPLATLPINYLVSYSGLTPAEGRPPELRITDPLASAGTLGCWAGQRQSGDRDRARAVGHLPDRHSTASTG